MRKSRLSQPVQDKLIELSVAGATARAAAELAGVNKNTAAYFHHLRLLIFHSCEHLEMFDGEVEADESYFVGCRSQMVADELMDFAVKQDCRIGMDA